MLSLQCFTCAALQQQCYTVVVAAVQVARMQTHLTMLMEPQHPEASLLQSLNYGKHIKVYHDD